MKALKSFAAAATLAVSALANAGNDVCPPQPPWNQPSIPDGSVASAEQMAKAQQAVADYVQEIELWNTCNAEVHGLQSGRMISRAREAAEAYNLELGEFRLQQNTAAIAATRD